MSDRTGYIFVVDEPMRANLLEADIGLLGSFTDVMSASDWKTKESEIFLISLGDGEELNYAALARRGNRVATRKYQVRFTQIHQFWPPIPFQLIESRISAKLRQHFIRSSQGLGNAIPPKTWGEVLQAIKALQPTAAAAIDRLQELRDFAPSRLIQIPGAETAAQERDATNLALRMAGFDPSPILDWNPPAPTLAGSLPPFLQGLPSARIWEDQMVAHDAKIFGNWERIADLVSGVSVFENATHRLSVMNVNRLPLEHVIGVDLLYYVHTFNAYVLVQYKRMSHQGRGFEYRPSDRSYHRELERMQDFLKAFSPDGKPCSLAEYRLNSTPFYFKLCPEITFDPTSTEMIRGMYIPFDYWELLAESEQVRGPKGGVRITFENCGRYLNNTLFTSLVQSGWIGSQVVQTDRITSYILDAQEQRKSVLLAAKLPWDL